MNPSRFPCVLRIGIAFATACAPSRSVSPSHPPSVLAEGSDTSRVGFIVAAPDRGFLGNEEIADSFAPFARQHNAALVHVTDERTRASMVAAAQRLVARGAAQVVVLPLFLTEAESGFRQLSATVAKAGWPVPVTLGRRFGSTYLAVELLADRLRTIDGRTAPRVIIAGHGSTDERSNTAMTAELQTLADRATQGMGFESVRTVVWRDRAAGTGGDIPSETAFGAALKGADHLAIVPFQLGPKLDSMMSFQAGLAGHLPETATLVADVTPDPLIGTWMFREARRHLPIRPEEVGVVFLAHGADHHWNEAMRAAVGDLTNRYRIELAFSMADPPVVERAIRKLEARGARAIVIVRVFGLAASFRATVERMIGADVESGAEMAGGHDHTMHGHGHGPAGAPPPRIRSASLITTVGGLEDSPHFAAALLDRALELSKDPSKETVILVAHGAGDEGGNEHWRQLLGSLAEQMNRAHQGTSFRAIRFGTWREDWPEKHATELTAIRAMVETASSDGGRALVVPARTISRGAENEFLAGLRYELGHGFAPHPRFQAWLEEQIALGIASLQTSPTPAAHRHAHH